MAMLGIQRTPDGGDVIVPTELATTLFGILGGIGGALAQLVAGQRLSTVEGEGVSGKALMPSILVNIAGTVASAFLVPTAAIGLGRAARSAAAAL